MKKGVEVVEKKREGRKVGGEEAKGEKEVEGLFIETGICAGAKALSTLASTSWTMKN